MQTGRRAIVVLIQGEQMLGALPPVSLELPWWPEVHDVVAAVRDRYGIEVTVLRLLRGLSDRAAGGEVSYLAETDRRPEVRLEPWPEDALADEPLRQPWARPGGPRDLLAWADGQLAAAGLTRTGPARQLKSWNLSAIWRIPTSSSWVWFKVVPDFFAHEGAVIEWIGPPVVPRAIRHAPGRSLMTEIAGSPNHDASGSTALRPMAEMLTDLQQRAMNRCDELISLGVPDRRLDLMAPRIAAVVQHDGTALDTEQRRALDRLVSGLPERLDAVAACGVPDSLVHGDFHAGNVAGSPDRYAILDWGDSFVGHPLIDELAFTRELGAADRAAARGWFVAAWERIIPGSDPGRAADLLEPVLPLLAAVVYADFCANIEPDERIYHAADVPDMLRQAARHDQPA